MRREYGDVLAQLRERERELAQDAAGQRDARLERIAAVRSEAARQAARLARLRVDRRTSGRRAPPLPRARRAAGRRRRGVDATTCAARRCGARARGRARRRRQRVRATRCARRSPRPRPRPTIDDVLAGYVLQRADDVPGSIPRRPSDSAKPRRACSRASSSPTGAPLPAELEALARAIVLAPSVERAEALATELRLAVQRHRDAQARSAAESDEAQATARRASRGRAGAAAARARARRRRRRAPRRRACASRRRTCSTTPPPTASGASRRPRRIVLEQSLRDLGYEVEDIEATLFADGGTVHFRRAGWENYFVRMRVDPRERTANFNVVRASGDEDTAERRRLDALAEDRWCAEFPRLMETLAARGLTMDVTRRLDAGEVPVQVVERASLPRMHARTTRAAAPRAARAAARRRWPMRHDAALDTRPRAALVDPLAVRRRRQHPRQLPHAARRAHDARAAAALPVGAPGAARLPLPARLRPGRRPAPVSERARGGRAGDEALRAEARPTA